MNSAIFIQENAFDNVICQNGVHFLQGDELTGNEQLIGQIGIMLFAIMCVDPVFKSIAYNLWAPESAAVNWN